MKSTAGGPVAAAGAPARPGRHAGRRVHEIATNCEMCFWRCAVQAKVDEGRVVRVEGNPENPLTLGRLCQRHSRKSGTLNEGVFDTVQSVARTTLEQ